MRPAIIVAGMLLFLAACAKVGPDYTPPQMEMDAGWQTALASNTTSGDAEISSWWARLNDPILSDLINRALANNHDLSSAISKLRESRARLGMSKSGLYPTVDASASANRSRSSQNMGGGSVGESYGASLDASWEVDLFGGKRRAVEAAYADMESLREAMHAVRVSLVSEVALNYINVRSCQHRIAMAQAKILALEEEAGLISAKREAGFASELEKVEAEGALHEANSKLPSLRKGLEESMNRLCVLLGMRPGKLNLSASAPVPSAPSDIAVGLPADLLRRRPDIRKAERNLAAETARVGVSVSDLYPKLQISGSIGYKSKSSGSLFSSESETYAIGPSISLPLFQGGYIRSNIEARKEVQSQALMAYEKTVLGAIEEAENALAAYREALAQADSLRHALDALLRVESLTRNLYEAGLRDYRTYLDINMKRISMEDSLAVSEAEVTTRLVGLYKALGGGWDPNENLKETLDGQQPQ